MLPLAVPLLGAAEVNMFSIAKFEVEPEVLEGLFHAEVFQQGLSLDQGFFLQIL